MYTVNYKSLDGDLHEINFDSKSEAITFSEMVAENYDVVRDSVKIYDSKSNKVHK